MTCFNLILPFNYFIGCVVNTVNTLQSVREFWVNK